MGAMASQITSLTIVYSTVYSGADQRKHQSCASLAIVREIHRWPGNSSHKKPVTQKIVSFDDVIMCRDPVYNNHIPRLGSWSFRNWKASDSIRFISIIKNVSDFADSDSDNDLFTINTIRYISMACDKEYLTVCGERIPQRFIELHDFKVNKIVNTFNKHSFNISSA